jgi:hypothetical protein
MFKVNHLELYPLVANLFNRKEIDSNRSDNNIFCQMT